MEFEKEEVFKTEKILSVIIGLIASIITFGYGVYGLILGKCTLLGRGNNPIGTFVTFYGYQGRIISSVYIGAGILLFARFYIRNTKNKLLCSTLSYAGILLLIFGLCSSLFIMLAPLFKN